MLLVAALAAIAGCTGTSGAQPPRHPPPPEHRVLKFSLRGGFVTGTLKIPAQPAGPKPAILQPILDEERLLAAGYVPVHFHTNWRALAPLAKATRAERSGAGTDSEEPSGTSVGKWLLAAPHPGLVGRDYFALIGGEADTSVPAVIDHLEGVAEIDPRRIAIAGSSTAGFVALEALVHEPRLAAAAVRVACGDYRAFLRSSSLALAGEERWLTDGELVLDETYAQRLRDHEPIRFPERFPPRPVLLLNGEDDPAVPIGCARATARALEPAYARRGMAERLRFVLYEGRGHDLGEQSADEIFAWWQRWLACPGSGS